MITLTFRVPEELDKELEFACKEQDRSKSWFIKQALQDKLDEWKEYQIGIRALKDHYKNGAISHSINSVAKEFGIKLESTKTKKIL